MIQSKKNVVSNFILPPFKYTNFNILWFSTISYYFGRWIETTVGAWLVLEMTNSPFLVGLLGVCRFVSMLLGPFCGTIADRINRRTILLAVLVSYSSASVSILLLFYLSHLEVWHIFAFTIVGGLAHTFDYSTRYAIAADIVQAKHVIQAASLIMVATGVTQLFGPLVGGKLLERVGTNGCFILITICFLLSFLILLPMKINTSTQPLIRQTWRDLLSGIYYVLNNKLLVSFILLALLANLLIFPYWFTLMSIFARDILRVGASGYGQLMAAVGFGSFIGYLIIGTLPQSVTNNKLLTAAASLLWPLILLVFSSSTNFFLSIILLISAGIAQGMLMALIQSLLLANSSEEMRGRVSGVRAWAVGILPLGNLLAGYGADLFGAPMVLTINSLIAIFITILILIWTFKFSSNKSYFKGG
ncbi:MAG: MFS transporter [Dehalococcoidales bacterium]|nr:MFS transporter [Dehalococcoidales bacterium]